MVLWVLDCLIIGFKCCLIWVVRVRRRSSSVDFSVTLCFVRVIVCCNSVMIMIKKYLMVIWVWFKELILKLVLLLWVLVLILRKFRILKASLEIWYRRTLWWFIKFKVVSIVLLFLWWWMCISYYFVVSFYIWVWCVLRSFLLSSFFVRRSSSLSISSVRIVGVRVLLIDLLLCFNLRLWWCV